MNQGVLALGDKPQVVEITKNAVIRQPDMLAAINLSVNASGLPEKQIFMALDIEKAAWSKAMSGSNHFPAKKLNALCDATGNEIPLEWWAHSRGYKLERLQTSLEEENARLKQMVAERDRDLETIRQLFRETRIA